MAAIGRARTIQFTDPALQIVEIANAGNRVAHALEPDIVDVGGDTEKHQAIAIKQGSHLLQLLQHLVRLRVRGRTQEGQYHVAPRDAAETEAALRSRGQVEPWDGLAHCQRRSSHANHSTTSQLGYHGATCATLAMSIAVWGARRHPAALAAAHRIRLNQSSDKEADSSARTAAASASSPDISVSFFSTASRELRVS